MAVTLGTEPTDEQLVAALAHQELGALEVLYERHHRLALALACRILGDQQAGEDVVQEVFLAVWRQADRYRPERGSVKTWLLAIMHHRAIDRLPRKEGRGMAELHERIEDQRAAPVWQQVFEHIRGEQIVTALATLPADQRETIELAYFGGKSQREIASEHGVPLGTVKGRTRLALEKLRGLLVGFREEPV